MKGSRKITVLSMLIIAGGLAACERKYETTNSSTAPAPSREPPRATTNSSVTSRPVPNTTPNSNQVNPPSVPPTTPDIGKTPMDQSESAAQIAITAEIRKAIIADKSMSMNAQNCKIITEKSGVVTLRGKVDSQAEKDAIETKAKAVAGVSRVDNQLEVKVN